MATEEIEISQLELAEEILADMVMPVETATETKAITLSQLKKWLGSPLPTGLIFPAVGRIDNSRFTLLDGKTLSRTGTYEDFCNKVIEQVNAGNWFSCTQSEYDEDLSNYGQCGRFVIETNYVRIPTITRYIGATITLSEIGKTYAESLPNITGILDLADNNGRSLYHDRSTGCFANGEGTTRTPMSVSSGSGTTTPVKFDASLSSSTYQEGEKVNPEHTKYPYYMVISTIGQTEEVGIDINNVYEDLNLKANKDLSDVSQAGKESVVGWGMPDYSAEVSWVWGGSDNVAPCDGLVQVYWYGNSNDIITINIAGTQINYKTSNASAEREYLPISKGEIFKASGGTSNQYIKFFPYKGVKNA